jgi:hypothetical protein
VEEKAKVKAAAAEKKQKAKVAASDKRAKAKEEAAAVTGPFPLLLNTL